jgi:hypothetical protein
VEGGREGGREGATLARAERLVRWPEWGRYWAWVMVILCTSSLLFNNTWRICSGSLDVIQQK